jgi:hypothetical protein
MAWLNFYKNICARVCLARISKPSPGEKGRVLKLLLERKARSEPRGYIGAKCYGTLGLRQHKRQAFRLIFARTEVLSHPSV